MEPTMTLATALTTGLVQLGGIVADKVVEYVGAEPISTQIKNRLRKREQDKLLLTAVQSGLNEIDALANNGDMLLGWRMQLHDLTAKNEDALRQLMARHVISYVSDSEPVPPELVKALKWPDSHLSKLKKLLLTLRQALAADEEWQHVLAYANQVTSVQRIELVTKQLDSVITETLEGTAVRVIQVEDKPDAAKILKPYFDWVQRQCTRLSLSPLDPTQQESGHFGLGQVFINLNSGSLKPNGEHAMRLQLEQGRMPRPHAALANIHANPQIVLLGDPGSGKSTLLRYLALCLSNALIWPEANWLQKLSWKVGFIDETAASNESTAETRHWTHAKLIPVTVTLRDFAQSTFTASDPTAIFDFIVEHLCANDLEATVELLRSEAQAGRVIFLLDGVDEVPIGRRSAVWQAIGSLTNGVYGRCRWVVTCRVLSFVASEMPRKWPVQTLQPLNQEQIDTFVTSWFYGLVDAGEIPKQDAPQKSGALQQATRRKKLQPLAQNPMLLTIMALVQTFHGTLPNARAKLYQTCVETLLLRWQRHKEQGGGAALP
ncbi:MAG: NACHT domain-containing protein, partial [Candidatus Promineifilaceae bacterium]